MTIDEAIKELEKDIPPIPTVEWSKHTRAKALGIEALKRMKRLRDCYGEEAQRLLPGETKD